jgi:hypothetical protein
MSDTSNIRPTEVDRFGEPVVESAARQAARRRVEKRRKFQGDVVTFVVINAFLVALWAITGRGYFWPAWIMGAWGIGLIMHAWTVYGQRPITEADIEREMERESQRDTRPSDTP